MDGASAAGEKGAAPTGANRLDSPVIASAGGGGGAGGGTEGAGASGAGASTGFSPLTATGGAATYTCVFADASTCGDAMRRALRRGDATARSALPGAAAVTVAGAEGTAARAASVMVVESATEAPATPSGRLRLSLALCSV